ncbi:hypothetical protein J7E91_15850 [Streptomyces sp. ISL-99]|nr:hypothetical protein [Streptomyces sp. ISL-99]
MNMQQGAGKADAITQQTLSSIKPVLRWTHGPSSDSDCTDFKSDPLGTGSVTRRIRIMTIVSTERRGSLLGIVERNWKAQGYKITSINADEDFPAIYASTPEDFRMSVSVGGEGQFEFDIATPCFTDSPVADPTAEPNTPPYEGGKPIPRPNIRDDFWSALTPIPANSTASPTP